MISVQILYDGVRSLRSCIVHTSRDSHDPDRGSGHGGYPPFQCCATPPWCVRDTSSVGGSLKRPVKVLTVAGGPVTPRVYPRGPSFRSRRLPSGVPTRSPCVFYVSRSGPPHVLLFVPLRPTRPQSSSSSSLSGPPIPTHPPSRSVPVSRPSGRLATS